MQPSQQHVAPCVKGVEWGSGRRGLRKVGGFWPGIPAEVTQETGLVPRYRRAVISIWIWGYSNMEMIFISKILPT